MNAIPVEQAEGRLAAIIESLSPGEEVVLTRADQAVATQRATHGHAKQQPQFGTLRGSILKIAGDFDAIPEGFEV